MRVRFLLGFILLVAGVYSEDTSSSSVAPTTVPDTTVLTTVPAVASTSTPSAQDATTVTVPTVTGGSTVTGGDATVTRDATVPTTPASAGSSAAPVVGGSTTAAPLPDVTVNVLQFAPASCSDDSCTYSFSAPGNSQTFLATEDSIISDDRETYNGLQSSADQKDANIRQANQAAQDQIDQIQSLIDQIQKNLDQINGNIAAIQVAQADAQDNLDLVDGFISTVNKAVDNCLYQRCLKPTTPAPPTTTPTPAPTTPPSPCLNFSCPDDVTGEQYCKLDAFNTPSCTNCVGNLDGTKHCLTPTCSQFGSDIVLSGDNSATLYSTGYNSTSPADSVVPAGANCKWQINGTYQTTDKFNLTCLTSGNVVMYVQTPSGDYSQILTSTISLRAVNSALKKIENPVFTLTSSKSEAGFCSIPLTVLATEQNEKANEKNGFFTWLMGY